MANARAQYDQLSDEDKRILSEYHNKDSKNPQHPAHPDNPKHHEFIKGLFQKFGNAAVFGAGATAGSDLINSLFK